MKSNCFVNRLIHYMAPVKVSEIRQLAGIKNLIAHTNKESAHPVGNGFSQIDKRILIFQEIISN